MLEFETLAAWIQQQGAGLVLELEEEEMVGVEGSGVDM